MNDKVEPERLTWRPEELRGQDLRGQDLRAIEGLLPEHLAGADLTGAKLPDEIATFPALGQVAAISSEARKIFIGLLAACVYSWLVIGTTTDVALILNTASSPLPIINTPIPIADFYWVGPTILAAVYCYLHFYLLRLWRTLATLPAIFPDGTALDDRTDPWLLTGLTRTYMPRIPARPLGYVENGISVLLAWLLVPFTLFFCWWRLLPAHHINRLIWLALLIAFTLFIGWRTFHLARTALQRQVAPSDRARALLGGIWRDFRASNGEIALFCLVSGIIGVSSMFACWQSPRDAVTNSVVVFWPYAPWRSLREVDPTPAKLLNFVGIRTYADLREVNVAVPPDGWDGKDWEKVKSVDLRGRNLTFADAESAFLANADLRGANLRGAKLGSAQLRGANLRGATLQADLEKAQLQGADLREADLRGASLLKAQLQGAHLEMAQMQGVILSYAQLQGAYLEGAQLQFAYLKRAQLQGANLTYQLQGADLSGAQLQRVDLSGAQLQGADLEQAQLQGADLEQAQLQGADLKRARLQGADLKRAQLQGANLEKAQLQGADLSFAQLQGADLSSAQLQGAFLHVIGLQGADLRRTTIWRAQVNVDNHALWNLADLRGSTVRPMTDSEIDVLISEVTSGISNERVRKLAAERLNSWRTAERPARPDFFREWRSEPNVMFEPGDPKPEPFDWGPSRWATEQAYDVELANYLGELACGPDVPDTQTSSLAQRALGTALRESNRVWPVRFFQRVIGDDCPPAKRLPDDMRSRLQQLAERDAAAAAREASPPDPGERRDSM